MRIALITIGGGADDTAAQRQFLLGRSVALRQLEFAQAAGCDAAIGLGDGADALAVELRRVAEKRGMKFRTMGNTHNLLGAIGTGDELLVIAPGIVPESTEAVNLLTVRQAVAVLPVEAGIAAGLERIDAMHAWAGVLLMPGRLVERLAQLPRECDAAAALLRIALQARVEIVPLAPSVLADGSWMVASPAEAQRNEMENAMLERRLPRQWPVPPSRWLSTALLRRFAPAMLRRGATTLVLKGGVIILAAGACLAAAYGHPGAGLIAVAVMVVLGEMAIGFDRLRLSPLLPGGVPGRLAGWSRWLVDAVLFVCATLAIGAAWHRQVFPPLVLLLALHAGGPAMRGGVRALVNDRAIIALALGLAALAGYAEQAIMAAAAVALALPAIRWTPRGKSRITPA